MSASAGMVAPRNGGNFLRTVKAVGWGLFGVRKNSDYQEDLGRLNPLHVIVIALLAVALFVGGLMLVVNWVVS